MRSIAAWPFIIVTLALAYASFQVEEPAAAADIMLWAMISGFTAVAISIAAILWNQANRFYAYEIYKGDELIHNAIVSHNELHTHLACYCSGGYRLERGQEIPASEVEEMSFMERGLDHLTARR